MQDVIVIGAGPVGLACAIEARREGLQAAVIEKGALVNSIVGYPANMEFFSTPELIEIGGYPFPVQGYKPTREEAIEYYRGVTQREAIELHLYERVLEVRGDHGDFTVVTTKDAHAARNIVVSTGFFDQPNLMNVPGEDLPKVTHYYREPFPYVQQKVAVIGARNSAAKAALDCYRHGAQVTMIVRSPELSDKIKYRIRPTWRTASRRAASRRCSTRRSGRSVKGHCWSRPRKACRKSRTTGCWRRRGITRITASSNNSAWSFETMAFARRSMTRRPSKRPARASTSQERYAAATRRAAGSSRTAASTRGRSPGTSPAAGPSGSFENIHWKTEE